MTVIAAAADGRRVVVGGDSCVSWDGTSIASPTPKVWRRGSFVFGFAGDAPLHDALQYRLRLPPPGEPIADLRAWTVEHLARQVRAAVRRAGGEQPELALLIAHGAELVMVDEAASVIAAGAYAAIGSGADYALGALHATRHLAAPALRVEAALLAAEQHCPDVRRPWTVMNT